MGEVTSAGPRRCFLFAGYSSASTVDRIDLFHIKELARRGDVYVYMDNETLDPAGRKSAEGYAHRVIAGEHGEYDFGSWKRLVQHIGWEALDAYDEVILVNNSVVLVGDLDTLLSRASASPAPFGAAVLLDEHYTGPPVHVKDYLRNTNIFYASAMFASFWWSLKRDLIRQPFFRDFILGVKQQPCRLDVCYEYERAFTRSLLRHGVDYSIFLERVFKMSYIYTGDAFDLVEMGLPYIKRKLFAQNYYRIPYLHARIQGLSRRVAPEVAEMVSGYLPAKSQ